VNGNHSSLSIRVPQVGSTRESEKSEREKREPEVGKIGTASAANPVWRYLKEGKKGGRKREE